MSKSSIPAKGVYLGPYFAAVFLKGDSCSACGKLGIITHAKTHFLRTAKSRKPGRFKNDRVPRIKPGTRASTTFLWTPFVLF